MRDEPWTVRPPTDDEDDAGVPPDVLEAAYRAIEARGDGSVLPLVFDSLLGERRAALGGTRQLRFGADDPHVEIALQDAGPGLDAAISVVPHREVEMTVRHGSGSETVRTDRYGRARVHIGHGPLSVVLEVAGEDPTETSWVNV